ncbi:uncharacterized protein LOC123396655 [Hordeum vulgare subsp. vulgare]|uniref:uncharacterized protein LOC123396655 n=1 Tax=Hordeum vulgare subsp. vulgare TaxID=112509 RepID=UPI001D1A4E1D|nr:uncharacterized protein LOC123396655 [Hordeum vulgare subsp. vulgare]
MSVANLDMLGCPEPPATMDEPELHRAAAPAALVPIVPRRWDTGRCRSSLAGLPFSSTVQPQPWSFAQAPIRAAVLPSPAAIRRNRPAQIRAGCARIHRTLARSVVAQPQPHRPTPSRRLLSPLPLPRAEDGWRRSIPPNTDRASEVLACRAPDTAQLLYCALQAQSPHRRPTWHIRPRSGLLHQPPGRPTSFPTSRPMSPRVAQACRHVRNRSTTMS